MITRGIVDRAPGNTKEYLAAHDGKGITHVRVLKTTEPTPFSVLILELPPGSTEGAHHHHDDDVGLEHYLVLEGELVIVIDGQEHHLSVGDAMAIPRVAIRETRNESGHEARAILVVERQ